MKTVALISGGKDSCYNMMQCISEGHEIVALANLRPKDKDELDSYMYQTVGHHAIDMYAEAIGLPLYRHTIQGGSTVIDKDYTPTPGDEVEDLYVLLKQIKDELQIEAVSVGAILSDYQRVRVENVCQRLGLTSLAYLWRRDQSELLKEMIDSGLTAVLIKVASMGLNPKRHLGRTIKELYPQLLSMNKDFELNVCGEGGEYETFTTDCPIFNKSIILDLTEEVIHSDDAFAPVGYLNLKAVHLQDKDFDTTQSLTSRLLQFPLKRSCDIHKEIFTEKELTSLVDNVVETDCQMSVCRCEESIQIKVKKTDHDIWISGVTIEKDELQTIEELTKKIMDKLKDCINEASEGWDLSKLCMIHLYVKDLRDFTAINSVFKTYFGLNPPSRVCVQVPLPDNIALQIDCYGNHSEDDRYTMHVQSISHWAPANIGPYSQAVKINNKIYVAGQIAMVPSTLQIITGGARAEARLSLRHVNRILQVMPGKTCLQHIAMAICYVTRKDFIPIVKEEWNFAKTKCLEDKMSSCTSSLLEFVVVPKLPRNAKVEWQVYANIDNINHEVDKIVHTFNQLEATGRYRVHNTSLSCIITVGTQFNSPKTPDLKEVVDSFCHCYNDIVNKSCIEPRLLPLLRIFFPVSFCTYDSLMNELSSQMNKEVIYTLIPVIELSLSNTVVLGCQ